MLSFKLFMLPAAGLSMILWLLMGQAFANQMQPASTVPESKVPENKVIVTIKPLHSLVSAVMGATGQPLLLLEGTSSPHSYQLKPSQVKAMHQADLLFYIDPRFESFMRASQKTLPDTVQAVALSKQAALHLLPIRSGGVWEAHHDHANHDHADDDHDHEGYQDVDVKQGQAQDLHLWLDPDNAHALVMAIAEALGQAYPQNAAYYLNNARHEQLKITALKNEITQQLEGLQDRPFIVFHDAYQYFEQAFGLNGAGAITLDPALTPSIKRITELRAVVKARSVHCLFKEPQFSDRLLETLIANSDARIGELDPIGVDFPADSQAYYSMMRQLSHDFQACLRA